MANSRANSSVEVDRVCGKISFFDFLEHYLIPNRPCVIDQTLCKDWEAVKLWQRDGQPNFECLHKQFGELKWSQHSWYAYYKGVALQYILYSDLRPRSK